MKSLLDAIGEESLQFDGYSWIEGTGSNSATEETGR